LRSSNLNSTLVTNLWKISHNFLRQIHKPSPSCFPSTNIQSRTLWSYLLVHIIGIFFLKENSAWAWIIATLITDLDESYSRQAKIKIYEQDDALAISWNKVKLVFIQKNCLVFFPTYFDVQWNYCLTGHVALNLWQPEAVVVHMCCTCVITCTCPMELTYFTTIGSITEITSSGPNIHHQDYLVYDEQIKHPDAVHVPWLWPEVQCYQHPVKPLPACDSFSYCYTCLRADPQLNCVWCSDLEFCSDGINKNYHE
jgi:hypothetical protein